MKKIFYVFAIFAAVSVASCGNSTQAGAAQDTVDTVGVDTVDTVAVDSAMVDSVVK